MKYHECHISGDSWVGDGEVGGSHGLYSPLDITRLVMYVPEKWPHGFQTRLQCKAGIWEQFYAHATL